MTPYEALYGRRYKSFIYWVEVGERQLLEPEVGKRVRIAKEEIDLDFEFGEFVFLNMSPTEGSFVLERKES